VVLVVDIDRGGVIASIVGTVAVLPEDERARLKGYVINRFRGDPALFVPALDVIAAHTGLPCLGIVPWFAEAALLPAEDSASLGSGIAATGRALRIAVPRLPCIANFDDFDPLAAEPDVSLEMIAPGRALPGDADLVILPGWKSTIADLAFLRAQGWDIDIRAHHRRGGHLLGICGGYQLLGRTIADPDGIDGPAGTAPGLGLLAIDTVMTGDKSTVQVRGTHVGSGLPIEGYEIHIGRSDGPDCARPLLDLHGRFDGAISADGRVQGCYVHGLFSSDAFRRAFLAPFGIASSLAYEARVDAALDALADHLEQHVDIARLLQIARSRHSSGQAAA